MHRVIGPSEQYENCIPPIQSYQQVTLTKWNIFPCKYWNKRSTFLYTISPHNDCWCHTNTHTGIHWKYFQWKYDTSIDGAVDIQMSRFDCWMWTRIIIGQSISSVNIDIQIEQKTMHSFVSSFPRWLSSIPPLYVSYCSI